MIWLLAIVLTTAGGCAALKPPERPPAYFWIVHSAERSDADRVVDQQREPEKLLEFWRVMPGMRVAELGAADGYFTELLARVVGPKGAVFAQVPPGDGGPGAARLAARLKTPVMGGVVRVTRPFADPLPPEAQNLDFAVSNFVYHTLVRGGVDRAGMHRAVFRALKRGGVYAVTDHAGAPGGGTAQAAMQRTDPQLVRAEVEAAGFRATAEATFYGGAGGGQRFPAAAGGAGSFSLKFVKP